jgi:hypothetical protein
MRSLLLRWGVAVVVGTIWGAILSPRSPGTLGSKTAAWVSDAAHYAQSPKAINSLASGGDNPRSL